MLVRIVFFKFILYLPNIANASIARYIKPIKTDEKIAKENGIGRRTSTKNITSIVDQSDSFFIKSRHSASLSITHLLLTSQAYT